MRYALYFSPDPDTELAQLGSRWLGRDIQTGKPVDHPELKGLSGSGLAAITGSPRRYGFHATLKAPFRLAEGVDENELMAALDRFASQTPGFDIPQLSVTIVDGFVALTPVGPVDVINDFANCVVERFEPLRAALTENEIERRNPHRLSSVELNNLTRWGYPYVFDSFRFHMTLSTRLPPLEAERVARIAADYFAPALKAPIAVDWLCVFAEPEPGAPFEIHSRAALAARKQRKTA